MGSRPRQKKFWDWGGGKKWYINIGKGEGIVDVGCGSSFGMDAREGSEMWNGARMNGRTYTAHA
jgi:hypothetical protein